MVRPVRGQSGLPRAIVCQHLQTAPPRGPTLPDSSRESPSFCSKMIPGGMLQASRRAQNEVERVNREENRQNLHLTPRQARGHSVY